MMLEQAHVLLVGLSENVRNKLRVDWTIPATWIVGLALAMVVNVVVVVYKSAAILTTLENIVISQTKDQQQIKATHDRQMVNETKEAVMFQAIRDMEERVNVHARRIERLEGIALEGRRKQ